MIVNIISLIRIHVVQKGQVHLMAEHKLLNVIPSMNFYEFANDQQDHVTFNLLSIT